MKEKQIRPDKQDVQNGERTSAKKNRQSFARFKALAASLAIAASVALAGPQAGCHMEMASRDDDFCAVSGEQIDMPGTKTIAVSLNQSGPLVNRLGTEFNTDITSGHSLRARLESGEMVSGDPEDIQDGDTVCAGSVVEATSEVKKHWASTTLGVRSIYHGVKEEMVDHECPVAYEQDVRFLPQAVFEEHLSFGISNDFTPSLVWYEELQPFVDQPATYVFTVDEVYEGKAAGMNVFCAGEIRLELDGVVETVTALPSEGRASFALTSTGAHSIGSETSEEGCFAAVVKHPLNIEEGQDDFYMYYYANNYPAGGTSSKNISITVQECE